MVRPCSIFLGMEIPSILRSSLSCKFRDGYPSTHLGKFTAYIHTPTGTSFAPSVAHGAQPAQRISRSSS